MGVRATLCFGLLAALAAALACRLVYLQLLRADANRAAVARQRERVEVVPAPRGTIVDRAGRLLAYDRPVVEVRAEAYARLRGGSEAGDFAEFARRLAGDLAWALAAAPGGMTPLQHREALEARIHACPAGGDRLRRLTPARGDEPEVWQRRVDFLVDSAIDSAAVLERLDLVAAGRSYLHLHRIHDYVRCYPGGDAALGAVGFAGKCAVGEQTVDIYRGMEAFTGLQAHGAGEVESWQDAAGRRYWSSRATPPPAAAVLQTTLDLDLQRAADAELRAAAAAVAARYGSPPDWGALCLAEIDSGAVRAMASFRAGADARVAAFAPLQCVYPPGSVVKPLVFALALERGLLDWDGETLDCRPTEARGWRVPGARRWIRDSHACGVLAPRDVLVQSSNIGAVQVGLRLGREDMQRYLELYGWGAATGTLLPGELAGARPRRLAQMPDRLFYGYTAPSLSIGYEYAATPMQLLRAYVTLLSRRPRALRLYESVADAGGRRLVPAPADGEEFLSSETLALLVEAMRGVVSDELNATGRELHAVLLAAGAPGRVAGKTGTSEFEARVGPAGAPRVVTVRTASFAGFAPPEAPRFAAVCVLQKAGAALFWGGRYAAPAAGRLLLQALAGSPPAGAPPPPVRVAAGMDLRLAGGQRRGGQ